MMLNLEPASAQLLSILVRASDVTCALEIGTSNAYSTIWLAWSVAPAGERIVSIDRNPEKHVHAIVPVGKGLSIAYRG
jgi:predicted O-methyltransferase YrrM